MKSKMPTWLKDMNITARPWIVVETASLHLPPLYSRISIIFRVLLYANDMSTQDAALLHRYSKRVKVQGARHKLMLGYCVNNCIPSSAYSSVCCAQFRVCVVIF